MTTTTSLDRTQQMLLSAFGAEIQRFLQDDQIIEIMLNPDGWVHVESLKIGKLRSHVQLSPQQATNIIKLVAACHNSIADEKHPEVAFELPISRARFQGWLPPVVSQPCFVIRKRASQLFSLEDFVRSGVITGKQSAELKEAIQNKKNIIIAGGTGSGKTTFANALLHELANTNERILVIEDLPELQIQAKDVVLMRTSTEINMRQLIKGALRMRPDRIIIGEVRDGVALELLKSWNTGHPGGICTIHANSAEETPDRLADLIREAIENVPLRLITKSIDLIVFLKRDHAGKHRVESILHPQKI